MTKPSLNEVLKGLGFDEATVKKFEARAKAEKGQHSADEAKHADAELTAAFEKFTTKPDNQSLGALLILTGKAVEKDGLCDNCLLTIFEGISVTMGKLRLSEAIGVPFNSVHVL